MSLAQTVAAGVPVEVLRTLWHVAPIYRGETIVIIGGGPSLTPEQLNPAVDRARTIAINDAYILAPGADVLYATDAKWWGWHPDALEFAGIRAACKWRADLNRWHDEWNGNPFPQVHTLASTGEEGLESKPWGLRTGGNGGYQAINLAAHLGATRIILIGYDMQPGPDGKHHWFGDHPNGVAPLYDVNMLPHFPSLVDPLRDLGIEIFNCSPGSALTCFPMANLEDVL
ncbi:MAG: hypothetical protein IIA59_00630 [Candidatus Marinimicrobia bacterium]|nr:hypothetical protein [Candidatus Neomarinimicrobiota bacterium]